MNNAITCPSCGHIFELEDVFEKRIEENLRKKLNQKWIEEKNKLIEKTTKETEKKLSLDLNELKTQNEDLIKKISLTEQKEIEFRKREIFLSEKETNIEILTKQKVDQQKKELEQKIRNEFELKTSAELTDLQNELKRKTEENTELVKKELELRKAQREIEETRQKLELENARKLDEERKKIWATAKSQILEENQLKFAEKDKQIDDFRHQIDELNRKALISSQQAQGEIQELELERLLKQHFPIDIIEPVPKGITGADVIHTVLNRSGQYCGTIIWESKRTKNWSNDWIQKLKDDQQMAKANIAVIISSVLPKEVSHIGLIDRVWVSDFHSAIGLAMSLREGLLEVSRVQSTLAGKNEKKEILYDYLTSHEFRLRMEAIVKTFATMKDELEDEKRKIQSLWGKREKQLQRILENTSSLYGELRELSNKEIETIDMLELPAADDKFYLFVGEEDNN